MGDEMGGQMGDENANETNPSADESNVVTGARPAVGAPRASKQRLLPGRSGVGLAAVLATMVTLALVFGVLDVTHALFPQKAPDTSRPIVINARIVGGPTATTGATSDLRVAPEQLTMACHSAAVITLTASASQPVSWSVDSVGQVLLIGANQAQAGTLAAGKQTRVSFTSFGAAVDTTVTFADDQSNLQTVLVSIHCP
ncbi:MAG: hypothetical protein ACRDHE_07235 [Ktedonobacterales bacterium]